MVRALFVRPPYRQRITAETPRYEMPLAGYYPPLGMMSIATCVNEWTGHEARVIDAAILGMSEDELKHAIRKMQPDVVGLSSVTFTLLDTLMTARLVKEIGPDIPVVLGGIHAEQFPVETVALEDVDFVMKGDGEVGFPRFLEYLSGTVHLKDVPGLVYCREGIVNENQPEPLGNLDALPVVDRTLTPYKAYSSVFSERKPSTTVVSARGCPHRCSFCYQRAGTTPYRVRSPQKMVEEMRSCADLGIKEVIFYDDTFTAGRQRIMEFCDRLRKENLDITWDMRTRPDSINRKMLQKMKHVGLRRVQLGAESGTQAILDSVGKGLTLQQSEDAFAMVREAGLDSLGYFMLGLPGETREMMMDTVRFSLKLDPDYVNYSLFIPLPGSPFWDALVAKGDTAVRGAWERFASSPTPGFDAPTCNEHLSKAELQNVLDDAYKAFYLRPGFFWRELGRVRSPQAFLRKASTVMRIARSMVLGHPD